MGTGLRPPVHFTQATIQLPDGGGSELVCKSNMACVPLEGWESDGPLP